MTTVPATVTGNINAPSNLRVAHIVFTFPSVYTLGGIAVPVPAGFRKIRMASVSQRASTVTGSYKVASFNPATGKLILAHLPATVTGAEGFFEAASGYDASASTFDILAYDWDEENTVTVAAS